MDLVDHQVRKRWIIGTGSWSPNEPISERHLHDLERNNWQVRIREKPIAMNVIVVDNQRAFLKPHVYGGSDLSLSPSFLFSDLDIVTDLGRTFDTLWNGPGESIYKDESITWTSESQQQILTASEHQWNSLIRDLSRNPRLLYDLDHRKFEELVADLLKREGLATQLTPPKKDGGRDILAFADTLAGRHLYLVECKKYAEDNPVGVSLVRELYGVVMAERATAGLLVTTSRFTKGAIDFTVPINHQIGLKGYEDLVKWIRSAEGKNKLYRIPRMRKIWTL